MLDFRKTLALAAVSLGLAATAAFGAALPNITSGAVTANYVSLEGTTEQLPSVVLTVGGPGAVIAATSSFSFTLTANVPFTNVTPSSSSSNLDVFAYTTTTAANSDIGNVTLTSPTTVQITFPTVAVGTISAITIDGLRVNANVVPSPTINLTIGTLPAGGITLTSAGASIPNASYPVATLNTVKVAGFTNSPLSVFTNPKGNATIQPAIQVTFNGNQIGLLKTKAAAANGYTAVYPATGASGLVCTAPCVIPTATAATQGTRLALTINNLDSNVTYWAPAIIGDGTLQLSAYAAAAGGTALTPTTFTGSIAAVVAGADKANNSTASVTTLVQLPTPVNGSTTIYYGVTTGEPAAAGNVGGALASVVGPGLDWTDPVTTATDLVVYETVPSAGAVTSVSSSGETISISLVGATTGYPQFSATAAAYTANQGTNVNNGLITLNATTMLFPYVIDVGGFDTGIAVTNASTGAPNDTGAGGLGAASPTSATCTATFYGTGVPSTNPYSLGVVATGSVAVFDVGTVAPGFAGYVLVNCNFFEAHGYALISNGLGTGNGIAANYLAVTVSEGTNAVPTVTAQ